MYDDFPTTKLSILTNVENVVQFQFQFQKLYENLTTCSLTPSGQNLVRFSQTESQSIII